MRQYVIFDPPTIVYDSHQTLNRGIPFIVWQQQMGKTYIRRYNIMHKIHKTLPTYIYDYTDNFATKSRPLPEVVAYDTNSLTFNKELTPIGMKTYMTKTNWSTKILTANLTTKLKMMI